MTNKKKEIDWEAWIGGAAIVVPIILAIIGSQLGWFNHPKTNSDSSASDTSSLISNAADDMNSKYDELVDAAQTMAADIDTQCVWLDDNISSSVADYCDDALDNYGYINTEGGNIVEASDYDDEDTPVEDAIQQMVDDANSKYNDYLEKAQSMSDTMDDECTWLYDNISSDVADHCNDTTHDFRFSNFSSDPFSASDYS